MRHKACWKPGHREMEVSYGCVGQGMMREIAGFRGLLATALFALIMDPSAFAKVVPDRCLMRWWIVNGEWDCGSLTVSAVLTVRLLWWFGGFDVLTLCWLRKAHLFGFRSNTEETILPNEWPIVWKMAHFMKKPT